MREKLIELLETHCDYAGHVDCKDDCTQCLADHLIHHGVTVQEWIPASEPPKESKEYIVMIEGGTVSTCLFYSVAYKGWFTFYDDEHECPYKVTHWMPLPQAPKGE